MSQYVYLFLKANGVDIQGESTVTSLDRESSIECLEYRDSVAVQTEAGSHLSLGRRNYGPIKIKKVIDRSTPLLFKALTNNEEIEAEFRFYRPNPAGDGTTQQFFTVEIRRARISTIERVNPNPYDVMDTSHPAYEVVGFVFGSITITYEDGGITHQDTWSRGE
jgi:type VI secretion system secreted protein Hcp